MEGVQTSPFYEPFKEANVPVILLQHEMDEIILQGAGSYKDFQFENIE